MSSDQEDFGSTEELESHVRQLELQRAKIADQLHDDMSVVTQIRLEAELAGLKAQLQTMQKYLTVDELQEALHD